MKILLLEDDYLYKVSIKEFLQELDFIVDDFENGDEALDAVFTNSYDLLLLAWMVLLWLKLLEKRA